VATKNFEVSDDNTITAGMEDLSEEEHQRYLVAEAHLKNQFLKGFKKGRGNMVSRVQDFVMPSFMKVHLAPLVEGLNSFIL